MDIIQALFGFLLIFIALYLFGRGFVVLLKLQLEFIQDIFYSTVFGILLFTFFAYILSFFHISQLLFPITLIIILFNLFKLRGKQSFSSINAHKLPLTIVGMLSLIFSGIMLVTGKWGQNIVFRHDDSWHIALINELKVHFPPNNPGFSNIPLKGYHFFYDYFAAMLSNTFRVTSLSLHFHILPLFFAVLFGLGIYMLMFAWQKNKTVALIAVFLGMFGGSFAFLFAPFIYPSISLDNGLGILQSASILYNPPLAISFVILLFTCYSFFQYFSTRKNNWLIPLIFAVGLLPMFKIYAGIILCIGFVIFAFIALLCKQLFPIVIGICSLFIIFITYGMFAGKSLYILWYPFWGPHLLLQTLNIYSFATKHEVTRSIQSIAQRIWFELLGLVLFVFGNLGTRMIGFFGLRKKNFVHNLYFTFVIASMGVASLILPLFFIQSLKELEIIQFASYYLFIVSLFASIGVYGIYKKLPKPFGIIVLIILSLLTLPSAYEQYALLPNVIHKKISTQSPQMQAIQFLSSQGSYDNTVLELPPRYSLITDPNLQEWYATISNPVTIALANKQGFANNEFIDFPNVNLKQRIQFLKQVINTQDKTLERIHATEIALRKNKITYIYMTTEIPELLQSKYIHKIFRNTGVTIYKVDPL